MKFMQRFHRDDSAQISFLAVAAVICFIGLLSMVINTDDIITDRVHMQDVADTTAISSAAWTARGLNMISFINVLNTKLISTAVLLNALADTIPVVKTVAQVQLAIFNACSGVPFVGAFCAAMAVVVNIQLNVLNPLQTAVDKLANALSRCDKGGGLWKVMKGLEVAATAVSKTFTFIGIAESIDMAKANGADFGLVVNGNMMSLDDAKDALFLPVKQEKFPAHCPFVKNGGSGYKMAGYECGTGPYKLGKNRIMGTILVPFVNLFAHPIFLGMSASHFSQVGCTNDPGEANNKFPVTLKDHNECQKYDAEAKWNHTYSRTRPLTESNLGSDDFAPWKPLNKSTSGGGDDEDIPDLGGIGDINVDEENKDQTEKQNFPMGKHYSDLRPASETSVIDDIDIPCNGMVYPNYQPPAFGFGSDMPGSILCVPGGLLGNCKRIDEWGQFTWYSATHQKNGPKTVGGYFMRVGSRKIEPDDENQPATYVYIVETVSMIGAGEKEMSQKEFEKYLEDSSGQDVDTEASKSSSKCDKPEPYVLDKGDNEEDFQNKLRFMSVVYRDIQNDRPFWSNYFENPPKVLVAYSQAQVYNHLAEDTFTQDWRVRLERASLLETLLSDKNKSGTLGELGTFANFIGKINNH
ncbi:MAG TPA: hypothetical protein PKK10_02480 [Woeseiaceae bacterium]|nr:hypothetical protein [Woeseiaceae bacterium]